MELKEEFNEYKKEIKFFEETSQNDYFRREIERCPKNSSYLCKTMKELVIKKRRKEGRRYSLKNKTKNNFSTIIHFHQPNTHCKRIENSVHSICELYKSFQISKYTK